MAVEIERKFLVRSDEWRRSSGSTRKIRQGYLCIAEPPLSAEVRIRCAPERAFITVKGKGGLARSEYEYEIPVADAERMLHQFCSTRIIEKVRHRVEYDGLSWEIDEYMGAHQGLALAEVELREETQEVSHPVWTGKEVTDDPRFKNANLALHPNSWRHQ
jgi:adenylate cyclase